MSLLSQEYFAAHKRVGISQATLNIQANIPNFLQTNWNYHIDYLL